MKENMNINDLCMLESQDDEDIVKIILERYESDYIYTYIGDILISVNPYKDVPINSEEVSRRYKNERSLTRSDAHVFGIVNDIYQCLTVNTESQCFIVSGESGAGKTDTVKLAVDHFLSLGPLDMNYMERISETSIILEAFGNALTSLNKNATRFGKYLQFHFSKEVRVCGVTITEYLLESSRLSCGKQGEQNFHIFYYMFSGRTEDDLSKQLLDSPSQHRYLNYGKAFSEELLLWSLEYKKLMQAFNSIGFTMEETTEIFGLLSAILHIGDIKFICEDPNTGVFIDNMETLDKVSILLGVDTSDLELCMTCNMVSRNNDNVSGFKSESEANTCRDSISKSLYARLFSWIVCKINFLLNPDDMKKRRIEQLTVAFLDVFGFEDFQMNSLEQLCINTTNEQIALHFTQHVFALEQVEYQQEELLDMDIMEYFDNKNIINLLLEKPHGIFSLLEEESKCLQADDQTLVSSFNAHCSEQKHYISSNAKTPSFNIVHYNRKVTYSAEEFLDKNNDKLEGSFVECLRGSSDILVSTLYSSTLSKTGSLSLKAGNGDVYCCTGDLRTSYEKRVKHRLKNGADTNKACRNTKSKQKTMTGRKQKNVLTVATYFRNSLVDLMENILLCQAHFVRCIKPNKSKEPNKFDKDFVKAQIKCSGIVDTMKIRKYGFSVRLPFKTFLDRFRCEKDIGIGECISIYEQFQIGAGNIAIAVYRFINFNASSTLESNIDNCKRILERSQVTDYRFGKTKVFLRQSHIHQLSSALQELIGKVVITQKMVRGHLARIDFDFLQTTRKQEEKNLGNLLVSISSRSNKMHDNLLILNQADLKRHERLKEKEMKKRDPEKENQLQKRKLTNPTDPDSLKMREFKKSSGNTAEETPNRKVPRNKSRTHGEPLIRNFTSSPQSTWCRVDCYERQHHIASFQMEEAVICVDGTHPFSDKNRIAFAALPSRADDPKVTKVKSCIGKGVQLHQDERQNLWATRLGKNPIFVRGHTLCPELVKLNGKLTQGVPMKVLDTAAFKDYMREEVDNNGGVNEDVKERIMSKLKICMSFIKDTAVDEDTPCWFEIWLLKVKDQVKRYLENQQKREKRKSGHLDMRVQTPQDSTKRLTGMPEMRRAKSGDHIRVERRPRSNTTNLSGSKESPSNKVPRPRPPSQNFSHQVIDKSLMRQQQQLQLSQDVIRREKSMDMIRREKSMDVRVESRMLMDREYRQSMGRPLIDGNQINRVRNGNSPSPSPPQSLMRSSGSNSSKRESTVDSGRLTNGNGTPLLNDPELRRGNSVTAPKAGMSYRQVFGLQSSDYLFNVTPPNYTRHRRFSDSDTESLHNFNFIHKVITAPSTPPISALGRQSPPSLQQQMSQQQQQHQTEDSKGNILSKKWMNKIRRKSEDNPKKKVSPQLSNK